MPECGRCTVCMPGKTHLISRYRLPSFGILSRLKWLVVTAELAERVLDLRRGRRNKPLNNHVGISRHKEIGAQGLGQSQTEGFSSRKPPMVS